MWLNLAKKLSTRMEGASTYHREMFAITQVVSKWRQYLLGRKFTIYTDQQSLKSLTNQTIQTPEQQKWLSKLVGYDFQIIYWPGKLNHAADALSRTPDVVMLPLLPGVMSSSKSSSLSITHIQSWLQFNIN